MKVGRNDSCPCGSGKKYKHCCLSASAPVELRSEELTWRRLHRVLEEFPRTIVRFIDDVYGSEAVHEAWDEFTLWDDVSEGFADSPHAQLFMPWFFHRWRPDAEDTQIQDASVHGRSPTELLLERKGERLDPLLRQYLRACVEAPFSFYDILHTEPGQRMQVRDIFTGTEYDVLEETASSTMRPGNILFGQFVPVEGVVVAEACSHLSFRPVNKIPLIKLRQEIAQDIDGELTPTALVESDMALREQYLQMMDQLTNPERPTIYNVDGEKIHPYRIVFNIDSAQVAFDALKDLCGKQTEQELLNDAGRGPDGELIYVSLDWTRPSNSTDTNWDTIFLASIEIFTDRIVAEVNSEERAEKLKQIVTERLGERARHEATESTLYEDVDEEADEEDFEEEDFLDHDEEYGDEDTTEAGNLLAPEAGQPGFSKSPELNAKLNEIITSYYENWITEQLPALDGRTPLEMVNEPDGREMVEALIQDIEISGRSMDPPLDEAIPRMMRERLGIRP